MHFPGDGSNRNVLGTFSETSIFRPHLVQNDNTDAQMLLCGLRNNVHEILSMFFMMG